MATSVTLGGDVTSTGGAAISERGVVYAITTANNNPQIGGTGVTKVSTSGTTGVFTVSCTGIASAKGFSFKAYAINSQGTTYSSVATFTTLALPPGSPSISDVANQTINEDNATSALPITIGDVETATSALTLSCTSSNTTLVPTANIVFGGSGSARTVTVTPVTNLSGTATITLTVNDGTYSTSDTFVLTVNSVNDAPSFALPGGAVWTARDTSRNWQTITSSADGTKLAAVVNNGYLYTSTDSGATWEQRNSVRYWLSVSSSADGTKLAACVSNGQIFTSTDSGLNWTTRQINRDWRSIASSTDGTKLAAVVFGGQIYTSTDSGANWTAQATARNWRFITSSADGTKLAAAVENGQIYTSTDSGVNWTARESNRNWRSITSSADGAKLAAVAYNGQIYTSTDSGVNWVARMTDSNRNWSSITSSTDGTKLAAVVFGGQIYTSINSGASWEARESARSWYGITSSADGSKLAALESPGQIYTSTSSDYSISVGAGSNTFQSSAFASSISPGPADEISQTVSFTVTNNNNSLFEMQPAIDANRTLSFEPGTAAGTATVTVTAVDTGGSANGGVSTSVQTFTITVTNTAPTISDVANQTINEDTVTNTLAVSVGDAEATHFTLSGSSSNTALVPNANIVFATFTASSRTVRVTPVPHLSGSATITLTVSDGSLTTSDTFVLTVNAQNDAPSFVSPAGGPAGTTWTARDSNRNWAFITSSADGSKLAATVDGGYIYTSTDSGLTWVPRMTDVNRNWLDITSSADGTKLAAVVENGQIYTSTDSGVNWTARDANRDWYSITSSADGTSLAAGEFGGRLFTSTDSGLTWVARTTNTNQDWFGITSSADGTRLAVAENGGGGTGDPPQIYTSADSGATWTARLSLSVYSQLRDVTSSADGSKLAAVDYGGRIHTSSDWGMNWAVSESNRNWFSITSSADGSKLSAGVLGGQIYTSSDSGVTWVARESVRNWLSITCSADGSKLAATDYGGQIYTSVGIDDYNITVAGDSGLYTSAAFATSISPGPADESAQTVSFTVTNDNNALFTSQPAIAANGTLSFTPGIAAGTATVTITAVDNGGTANGGVDSSTSQTFTITVTSEAPTLSDVADQSINEDTATSALPITVGDTETAASALTLSGTSSDTTLVPNANIVFGGNGAARTVTITPAANLNGSATITLTVSDGTYTASDTFVLTVNPVNDVPSFTLPAGPAGETWINRDTYRFWRCITSSADGTKLAAVVENGQIYTSTDSGVTWVPRESNRQWFSIASSADGSKLAAVERTGQIHTSTDSGATWVARDSNRNWYSIASSADGTKLAAVAFGEQIYTSSDSGATWTARESNRNWLAITSSADGSMLAAVVVSGQIYTSTDSGTTWAPRESSRIWVAITSSADGNKLAALVYGGQIHTSTNAGQTWVAQETNRNWRSITSSADGTKLAAVVEHGQIYTSTDSGLTWTASESNRYWWSITSSADGSKLAAVVQISLIYTSTGGTYSLSVPSGSGLSTTAAFATGISPGPADESSQTVNFTVSNDNNALFSTQPAIAANGTLTFAPACTPGTATVTITAVDDGGTANGGIDTSASQTITITITDSMNDWRTLHFGSAANSGNGENTADADFDGLANVVEYAFGLNPKSGGSLQTPPAVLSGGNLFFNYTQPPGVSCVNYGAEWSTDLIEWFPITDSGSGNNHLFSVPVGTNPKMFMRHRITKP